MKKAIIYIAIAAMMLTLVGCGRISDLIQNVIEEKSVQPTASETATDVSYYKETAQKLIVAEDYNGAAEVLREGIRETGDWELISMLNNIANLVDQDTTEDTPSQPEQTEPPATAAPTEPEETVSYPYTDERGVVYELVEPYPLPIANPQKGIYDKPGGNYLRSFGTIGYYTVVEQAEDPDGYTWGKLSTGEGWTMVYQQILPQLDMLFAGGAGFWGTSLSINGTGFFSGDYSDSDMGDCGTGYPNGTVYTCEFDGKFNVTNIGRYQVTLKLADLNTDVAQGYVWYSGGVRYIASIPYGLENCTYFTLYYPNTPVATLPYELQNRFGSSGVLDCYVLYNPSQGAAFVQ